MAISDHCRHTTNTATIDWCIKSAQYRSRSIPGRSLSGTESFTAVHSRCDAAQWMAGTQEK